eukprot:gene8205-809_t
METSQEQNENSNGSGDNTTSDVTFPDLSSLPPLSFAPNLSSVPQSAILPVPKNKTLVSNTSQQEYEYETSSRDINPPIKFSKEEKDLNPIADSKLPASWPSDQCSLSEKESPAKSVPLTPIQIETTSNQNDVSDGRSPSTQFNDRIHSDLIYSQSDSAPSEFKQEKSILTEDTQGTNSEMGAASTENVANPIFHWFWLHSSGTWVPFSIEDVNALEFALASNQSVVHIEDGRYRVDIPARKRIAQYWINDICDVVRNVWVVGEENNLRPLNPEDDALVEMCFQESVRSGQWKKTVDLSEGSQAILRHRHLFVLYEGQTAHNRAITDTRTPRRLTRGIAQVSDKFSSQTSRNICSPPFQNGTVPVSQQRAFDHLVLLLCGPIPETPDLRDLDFRIESGKIGTETDISNVLRNIADDLIATHFVVTDASKSAGCIEILPVHWKRPTIPPSMISTQLKNIRNLRSFVNEALTNTFTFVNQKEALISAVAAAIDSTVDAFRKQHPEFNGSISILAHGFAGVLLYNLLLPNVVNKTGSSHRPMSPSEHLTKFLTKHGLESIQEQLVAQDVDLSVLKHCSASDLEELKLSFGMTKRLSNAIQELKLPEVDPVSSSLTTSCKPIYLQSKIQNVFLLGSPLATYLALEEIPFVQDENTKWLNLFHPYDPLASRLNPIIGMDCEPFIVPHHKGRGKRFHLELKEYIQDTKRDLEREVRSWAGTAWSKFNEALKTRVGVDVGALGFGSLPVSEAEKSQVAESTEKYNEIITGVHSDSNQLTAQMDFVLQASTKDVVAQAIYAMKSHRCYWTSEDTMLFILSRLYTVK